MPLLTTDRIAKLREVEKAITKRKTAGAVYGLVKGLTVTMRTMMKPAITAQYPLVKPDLPPRTRGVIALKEENCTVCMLCSRECPDWCIYIDSHKDVMPPKTPGARSRTRNVLDRFAIDYALCMYCGICVEVCPFDALFWSPHFEYSTTDVQTLTHEMPQLGEWMAFVPPPPALEIGSDDPLELAAEDKAHSTPEAVAAPVATEPAPAVAPAETASGEPATGPEAAVESAGDKGSQPDDTTAASEPQEASVDHGPPQIHQETYDAQIAAGKSDREARAMAKKAWVIKSRKGEL